MPFDTAPALGRPGFNRAAERRADLGGTPDPRALVLVVDGDRAPTITGTEGDRPALQWMAADDPRLSGLGTDYAFLGVTDDGRERWVMAPHEVPESISAGSQWAPLRGIGGDLDAVDAGALVAAVSLGRWLTDSAHCPRCGTVASLHSAGWARRCPSCERDIFPRTDPAVIVAVTDPGGQRLLLGSHVAWGPGRFSCFAGFVEAGESLEATVVREVREEAGVDIEAMTYLGSQAWPYPRSLMVGFTAVTATESAVPDGEEIIEARWFDRSEIAPALRGESDLRLPGPASIARTLIEHWFRSAAP